MKLSSETEKLCQECRTQRDRREIFVCITCDNAIVCAVCFMHCHRRHDYQELEEYLANRWEEFEERLERLTDQFRRISHRIDCMEPLKQLNVTFRQFVGSEGSNLNPKSDLRIKIRELLQTLLAEHNPTPAMYRQLETEVADVNQKLIETRSTSLEMFKQYSLMIGRAAGLDQQGPIELLSDELLTKIISHLNVVDRCRCTQVSRRWRTLTNSDEFWTENGHLNDLEINKMLNLKFSAKDQLQTSRTFLNACLISGDHVSSISIHLWDLEMLKFSVLGNVFKSCPCLDSVEFYCHFMTKGQFNLQLCEPLGNFGHKLRVLLLNIRGMDLVLTKEKDEIRIDFGSALHVCSNLQYFYVSGVNPLRGVDFESWLPIAKSLTKLGIFFVTREHWEIPSLRHCVHLRTLGLCLGAWQINCSLDGWVDKVFDGCKSLTKFAVLYPRRYERVQSDDLEQVLARGHQIKQFLFIFAPFTTKEFWNVFRQRPLNAPTISIILYDAPFLDVSSLSGLTGLDIKNYSSHKQSNWRHTIKNFFLDD